MFFADIEECLGIRCPQYGEIRAMRGYWKELGNLSICLDLHMFCISIPEECQCFSLVFESPIYLGWNIVCDDFHWPVTMSKHAPDEN